MKNNLNQLSVEDLQKVQSYIEELVSEKLGVPEKIETKEDQPEQPHNQHQSSKPLRKRNKPSSERKQKQPWEKRSSKPGETLARTEPLNISGDRPNLFLNMKEYNEHKDDVDIDKKLAGNNVLTTRDRDPGIVEVECKECNNIFEVHASVVQWEGKTPNFTCDRCLLHKKI